MSSCGFDSFLDYYDGNPDNWQPERGWCQTRYMLKLADYRGRLAEIPFDFHELLGSAGAAAGLHQRAVERLEFQSAERG